MFKSIKIKNLRAITELEIDNLGQVNLLVGQNNCGKTTVLEALFLLIGATNPHLPISVNSFRGLNIFHDELWPTFFHNMNIDNPINISGETTDKQGTRSLEIQARRKERSIFSGATDEVKASTGDSNIPFITDGLELISTNSLEPGEQHLSAVFQNGKGIGTEGAQECPTKGIFLHSTLQSDWRGRFGSLQRRKQEDQVVTLLKEIDPAITSLVLNEMGLIEADIGLADRIPVNLMGGGIVKFLSVALAMLDAQDGIVLIDEIENGLRHSAQETLWKAVLTWAEKLNVQVFATTHSYECIRAFEKASRDNLFSLNAKLCRIERDKEKIRSVEISTNDLEVMLENMWEMR